MSELVVVGLEPLPFAVTELTWRDLQLISSAPATFEQTGGREHLAALVHRLVIKQSPGPVFLHKLTAGKKPVSLLPQLIHYPLDISRGLDWTFPSNVDVQLCWDEALTMEIENRHTTSIQFSATAWIKRPNEFSSEF